LIIEIGFFLSYSTGQPEVMLIKPKKKTILSGTMITFISTKVNISTLSKSVTNAD